MKKTIIAAIDVSGSLIGGAPSSAQQPAPIANVLQRAACDDEIVGPRECLIVGGVEPVLGQ